MGSSLALAVGRRLPHWTVVWAARALADRVIEDQVHAVRHALADAGGPHLAPAAGGGQPVAVAELVCWRDDRSGAEGTVSQIAGYYRCLLPGRLAIVGEPNAGKTMAATQLVLDLARDLPASDPDPDSGERLLVPVLFSLPSFTPGLGRLASAPAAELLDEWLAGQLVSGYGILGVDARRLVADGWVLPVLDGLDEMDPVPLKGHGRAAGVLMGLNARGPAPIVLVSRHSLVAAGDGAGETSLLRDAQQIVLRPSTVAQVHKYLAHRFPTRVRPGRSSSAGNPCWTRWPPIPPVTDRPPS